MKYRFIFILIIALALLSGCSTASRDDNWGSFTSDDVYSTDGKYLAKHSAVRPEGYDTDMIQVDIYNAVTGEALSSFIPARASDFWGICWEEGSHNLWIQSGDTGIPAIPPLTVNGCIILMQYGPNQ